MTLVIKGRLPGLNDLIEAERRNRYVGAKLKKDAQDLIEDAISTQLPPKLKTPIRLEYTFYEPNRKRDKDNIASFAQKVVQDALVHSKRIPNDGWTDILGMSCMFAVDAEDPRIEVEILGGV